MGTKKLTKKEIEALKLIQQKNTAVVNEFGGLEIAKLQIEARKVDIIKFYNELKEEEAELGKTLSEKYGVGSIDIESGEFIPSEIENTEVASF
jgi:hypothetical protein